MINDRLIDAGELPLAVRDFGGTGRPLLLVHGAGGNLAMLTPLARALRARHRVVAVDLRGHGRSGDGDWSWDAALGDLAAVAAQLDLDRPAVVGHSLGGMVAALWGQRHPDAPGVVNLDGNPTPTRVDQVPDLDADVARAHLERLRAVFDAMLDDQGRPLDAERLGDLVQAQRAAARQLGADEKVWVESLRRNVEQRDRRTVLRPSRQLAAQVRTAMDTLDLVEVYATTQCPVLVVLATRDLPQQEPFGELYAAYRRELTARITAAVRRAPRLRLLPFDGASHAMVAEQPDRLATTIGDFLAGG